VKVCGVKKSVNWSERNLFTLVNVNKVRAKGGSIEGWVGGLGNSPQYGTNSSLSLINSIYFKFEG
jgi:hypothetical protein